jgi:uncharacterized damage-inducible protein DinB
MNTSQNLAKHLSQLYFGGSWTSVSLNSVLKGLNWEKAIVKEKDFNSVYTLAYHINYYVHEVRKVLEGGELEAKDEWSFSPPEIKSVTDWNKFLTQVWEDGEKLAEQLDKLPEKQLNTFFSDPKYGTYFRNLMGVIEHGYYHLGQMTILVKHFN